MGRARMDHHGKDDWRQPLGVFGDLDEMKRRELIRELAQIMKLTREYELPDSIRGRFGRMGFDSEGRVVVGPTTILGGSPADSLRTLFQKYMATKLELKDG